MNVHSTLLKFTFKRSKFSPTALCKNERAFHPAEVQFNVRKFTHAGLGKNERAFYPAEVHVQRSKVRPCGAR